MQQRKQKKRKGTEDTNRSYWNGSLPMFLVLSFRCVYVVEWFSSVICLICWFYSFWWDDFWIFLDSLYTLQDGQNLSCCHYPSPVIQGLLHFLSKTDNISRSVHYMYLELSLISPLSWLTGIVFQHEIFSSWDFSSTVPSTYKLQYPRAWVESHSVRLILLCHAMCKDMPSWAEERKACSHFSSFRLIPYWIGNYCEFCDKIMCGTYNLQCGQIFVYSMGE